MYGNILYWGIFLLMEVIALPDYFGEDGVIPVN